MTKTFLLAAAIASAFAAPPASAAEAVKIGMITTLSGPAGYLGQDIRDAFKLAIKDGKLGGVPVELKVEDDALKPGNGKQIADRMLSDDRIRLFTGINFSNVAEAAVPDIVDAGAFYISPNAAPSNFAGKNCNKNYFVASWQNDALHEAGGEYVNKLGYKSAVIIAPNYQAGKDALMGFKRTFKGKIVDEIYTNLDQTDFASVMAQIRAAKPEAVFQFEPGGMGIAFMRQYQQAGLLGQIPMVVAEPSMDGVILKALGKAAVGVRVALHWNSDFDNESNKEFVAAWTKAYNRPLTFAASQGYDTALLIASALKATDGKVSDADAFRAALRKADFKSVRGKFAFGPNQHPIQSWYEAEVVDGKNGPELKTVGTIYDDRGDAYSKECKM
ncbi:MAG: ABC transporter substrate-binding protein [Rhizobiales bacterium 65-9]|nr:ABC transporter substrate-binding protein [Hyphomicrobiales bacterium]OJY35746.1 MAG: ABC transporter substrate-binding protein [Rhizobiales bacterium 65-9]